LRKLTLYCKKTVHRLGGSAVAIAAASLVLLAGSASATVIGTVNITSGAASVTATGISLSFSPPCDTGSPPPAGLFTGSPGCSQGEVSSYTVGLTPLTSSVNGTPPVGSAVFIQSISAPLPATIIPFMQFLNSAGNAVGITVGATNTSFGTGSPNTNCTTATATLFATCSIYQGALIILENLGSNGTEATLVFTGTAWDGSGAPPANPSLFSGSISTQLTLVNGITGHAPGTGFVTPADVQAFFGCPNNSGSTVTAGQCTALNNSLSSSNSGTFSAVATVPEPASMALIGGGLLALGFWRKKRSQAL